MPPRRVAVALPASCAPAFAAPLERAGFALVGVGEAEVLVVGDAPPAGAPAGVPRVVVHPAAVADGFAELGPSALIPADAYVLRPHTLAAAVRWVLAEDRGARRSGPLRLVCIGTLTGDEPAGGAPRFGDATALTDHLVLGRSPARARDDVYLPSSHIARKHAQLVRDGGAVRLRDLASTNGTLLIRPGAPPLHLGFDDRPGWHPGADPAAGFHELRVGDELVFPGFYRFRLDGA